MGLYSTYSLAQGTPLSIQILVPAAAPERV